MGMEHDQDWYREQYDPFAQVTDYTALFSDWSLRSGRARQNNRCDLNVSYGPTPLQALDVFPSACANAPVFAFIHGGYWRGSDKAIHSFLAPALVEAGAVVVLLNYDLCPVVDIGSIVEQTTAGIGWVYQNIARYGGNPEHVVVAGHSAGGHLAAMQICRRAATRNGNPLPHISRALAISGLYDLAPVRRASFIQQDLRLTEGAVRGLSPVLLEPNAGSVIQLAVGGMESDEFIQQSQLLARQWGPQVATKCELIPQRDHFRVLEDLASSKGKLYAMALELLEL